MALQYSRDNIVVLDCEFTGLDRSNGDRILEVAVTVVSRDFTIKVKGPAIVIGQEEQALAELDLWNTNVHGPSGLVDRALTSSYDEATAEAEILAFLAQYVPKGASPLCGKGVREDREFLKKFMPKLYAFFRKDNLDANDLIKIARERKMKLFTTAKAHTAQADVDEIIEMFRYYLNALDLHVE